MPLLRSIRLFCAVLALVPHLSIQAAIELLDVEGASAFTGIPADDNNSEAVAIFGGIVGPDCTNGNDKVCSNCASTAFTTACNDTRIYDTLRLKIRYRSDSVSGTTAAGDSSGNAVTTLILENTSNVSQGVTHTATITWSSLCSGILNISGTCKDDAEGTLSVGVDANGDGDIADSDDDRTTITVRVKSSIEATARACDDTGINNTFGLCNFAVFPGDEKVFVKDIEVPEGFPTGSGITLNHFRFYFAEFDANDATADLAKFQSISHANEHFEVEVETDDDGNLELKQDSFPGLTNGQEYYFRAATVDQAGNVGFNTPDLRVDNGQAFHTKGVHSAVPSPVSGLLSENFQCFIATAAFGSPHDDHVRTLRRFRNRYLSSHWLGRLFVKTYYTLSPPLARYISAKPWLKTLVRWSLLPVVASAEIMLGFGPGVLALLLFLSAIAIIMGLRSFVRLRRRPHQTSP